MENKDMEKKERRKLGLLPALALCLLGLVAGFAGGLALGGRSVTRLEAELAAPRCNIEGHIASGAVRVRVNSGSVEWFDGLRWNRVSSLEELAALDPLVLAREGYADFEQTLTNRLEAEKEAAAAPADGEDAGGEGEDYLISLPKTGRKASSWSGGWSGGGGSGGGGGGGGGYTGDGEDIQWSGDYL